jgi:hypothetical protein
MEYIDRIKIGVLCFVGSKLCNGQCAFYFSPNKEGLREVLVWLLAWFLKWYEFYTPFNLLFKEGKPSIIM